jgi:hypothetical protein
MSLGIEEISVHEGGEEHAGEHLGAQRLVGLGGRAVNDGGAGASATVAAAMAS